MMHCDKCNIDFPEGLRYCKWCGQTLNIHTRSTGEIETCPACFSAVQSSWAFCKACGARLTGQAQEPLSAVCPRCNAVTDPGALNCLRCGEDLTQQGHAPARAAHGEVTAVFAHCPTCGEAVESGSMYCKACGSALYSQPSPFGASALLCSVCESYSPVGSAVCRVCGAALKSDQSTGEIATEKERSSTLPDLADHFPGEAGNQPPASEEAAESGAHTLNFIQDGETQVINAGQSPAARQDDLPTTAIPPKRGAETTVLPGVGGSKAENVGLTSTMQRPRITSPVEGEGEKAEPETATEMPAPPAASDSPPAPFSGLVTRVDIPSSFYFDSDEANASRKAESASDEFVSATSTDPQSTVVFGSGAEAPSAFENEDYRATTSWKEGETISHGEVVPGEVTTAPFGLEEPATDRRDANLAGTIELESLSAKAQPEIEAAGRPGDLKTRSANTADFAAKPDPWTPVPEHTAQPDLPPAPVAQPEKRNGAMIASVIVVVLVLAATGFAVWWYVLGGKPSPPTPQTATDSPPATQPTAQPAQPDKPAVPTAPEGMVMVAGGNYIIGRDDGSDLEKPQHTIALKPFYIDRTEVTNADYKKFIDATGHQPPSNWAGGNYPEGRDTYPVTGVTWQDAVDYARWAGKRLPTEAEWEAAARGSDGRVYPWGNEWRSEYANIGIKSSARYDEKQYPTEIASVGRFPDGRSPAGALDLIGNVWEWTADEFRLYDGNPVALENITVGPDRLKIRIEPGITYRIFRGGAFDGDKQHDASYRGLIDASKPYPKVGFRCVKDVR